MALGRVQPGTFGGRSRLSRIAADEVQGDKESISEKNQDEKREREREWGGGEVENLGRRVMYCSAEPHSLLSFRQMNNASRLNIENQSRRYCKMTICHGGTELTLH